MGRPKKKIKSSKKNNSLEQAHIYERVTKKIYEHLSPDCIIIHDDKIPGKDSGIARQIDVSIRGRVGTHEILIIVQCKNFKGSRVNVNHIGELHSVMQDVGASKGILVSNAGFTKGAKGLARKRGIDLCSIHDAETKDWRLELKYPVVWEEITPTFIFNCQVYLEKGDQLSTIDPPIISGINIIEELLNKWNNHEIKLDIVKQQYPINVPNPTYRLLDNREVPIENLRAYISLEKKYYFTYIDQLPSAKALRNESESSTNYVIPYKDLIETDPGKLIFIEDIEDLPIETKEHLHILRTPKFNTKNILAKMKIELLDE